MKQYHIQLMTYSSEGQVYQCVFTGDTNAVETMMLGHLSYLRELEHEPFAWEHIASGYCPPKKADWAEE